MSAIGTQTPDPVTGLPTSESGYFESTQSQNLEEDSSTFHKQAKNDTPSKTTKMSGQADDVIIQSDKPLPQPENENTETSDPVPVITEQEITLPSTTDDKTD